MPTAVLPPLSAALPKPTPIGAACGGAPKQSIPHLIADGRPGAERFGDRRLIAEGLLRGFVARSAGPGGGGCPLSTPLPGSLWSVPPPRAACQFASKTRPP